MGRQILIVLAGILLSILAAVTGGYLIYRLSALWPQAGPALARYVIGPLIAMLVGACVGVFAKSHPTILACLSLLPSGIVVLVFRSLNFTNLLLMILLVSFEMLVGAAMARLTFRTRRRTMQVAQ
jgi:hypothetical protein